MSKKLKVTAKDIADALTRNSGPFSRRRWIAVPNVSWGWGLNYEADLIVVSAAGWAYEVEIKVNKYDLLGDKTKRKFQRQPDKRIKKFWYAVPEDLREVAETTLSADYGIIVVRQAKNDYDFSRAEIVRPARDYKGCRKPTEAELKKLLHLGIMRYWDLRLKEKE